jgi:hypothetical protein
VQRVGANPIAAVVKTHAEHTTEVLPLTYAGRTRVFVLLLAGILLPLGAFAQEQIEIAGKKSDSVLENPGRLFDLKVPDGFKSENIEEPGILRWTKGSAEIFLAVGEVFQESGQVLFKALETAASADKRFESVKKVKLNKGRAILIKEKAPDDTSRLQVWRLVIITDSKVVNIDFTAPTKEFQVFAPDFEQVVKSFKLKSAS